MINDIPNVTNFKGIKNEIFCTSFSIFLSSEQLTKKNTKTSTKYLILNY